MPADLPPYPRAVGYHALGCATPCKSSRQRPRHLPAPYRQNPSPLAHHAGPPIKGGQGFRPLEDKTFFIMIALLTVTQAAGPTPSACLHRTPPQLQLEYAAPRLVGYDVGSDRAKGRARCRFGLCKGLATVSAQMSSRLRSGKIHHVAQPVAAL